MKDLSLNGIRMTPERLKVIQGSAFDGFENIENPKVRLSKMQDRHVQVLELVPRPTVDPTKHAIALMEKQGLKQAVFIAKGMVHVLGQQHEKLGTKPDPNNRKNHEKDLAFWKNVVGYMKNHGGNFDFEPSVLDRHFAANVAPQRLPVRNRDKRDKK